MEHARGHVWVLDSCLLYQHSHRAGHYKESHFDDGGVLLQDEEFCA
jgi:hypothetical protein